MPLFGKKNPCNSCPYKISTPLRHWNIEEFKDLLAKELDYFGTVYRCHKKDGCVCIGWLMDQDKRNFPSIALRISLSKNNIDRKYLDSLKSKSPMYDTVEEMCYSNYPELE